MSSRSFDSAEPLLDVLESLEAACAIVDIHLPAMNGVDLQRTLFERAPHMPVILVTGQDDPELRERALAGGAAGFFIKPFSEDDLVSKVIELVLSHIDDSSPN